MIRGVRKLAIGNRAVVRNVARRNAAVLRRGVAALSETTTLKARVAQNQSWRPQYAPNMMMGVRFFSVETINVPSMGDSITEGTVVQWTKGVGNYVNVDDVVVVVETDKVSVDVRTPKAGVITEHLVPEDTTIEVGAPLFKLDTDAQKPAEGAKEEKAKPAAEKPAAAPVPPKPAAAPAGEATAPPSSASTPPPSYSGPKAPSSPPKQATPPQQTPKPAAASPTSESPSSLLFQRTENRVKMNRMRLRIAERLKQAQNTYAMLTTFQETDMSSLIEFRSLYKEEFEKTHGVKLGFMSAFVKAAAQALKEVPGVNAVIDDEAKEIVYRDYADISVAVATPKGLVVPVVRNCESLSFAGIEKKIAELGEKARNGTLEMEEMAGGTFTISNGGVFGSLMGTPIVNPPQSAILGMHATKMRAVVNKKGEVVARPMMYLALTYDHRLIDGREAVTFLKSVAQKIEDPRRMLL